MAELIDFGRDEAEVFRDERDGAEGFRETREKFRAGAFDPLAVDGGLFFRGDGPVGLEAAEVVEADDVVHGVGAADAIDPPVAVVLEQHIPAIERVAPALAGLAEVVGRNAGDADGREIGVKLEEVGVSPDIGAVVGDKDGDIADEADGAVAAVMAQGLPLPVKGELDDAFHLKRGGELGAEPRERLWAAVRDFFGPGVPGSGGMLTAQDIEENKIVEPVGVVRAVFLEGLPLLRRVAGEEAGGGLLEQRHLGECGLPRSRRGRDVCLWRRRRGQDLPR